MSGAIQKEPLRLPHIPDSFGYSLLSSVSLLYPPSTEVGVHLIDSVRPLGEGRQGPELDHETQG